MFDITSSKLLLLGIVALLVIGPKDLPALLRTIGKYVGIIKRQAAEFRAQFDEAIRESELAELKKSVETIQQETEASMREATSSVERQLDDARRSVDSTMDDTKPADAPAVQADALAGQVDALPAPGSEGQTQPALNGASHPEEPLAESEVASSPAADAAGDSKRAAEKSGA